MYTFDGINKLIILNTGVTSFDVSDLYSRWKDWVLESDNSKFLPAFANSVGGDALGNGQFVGQYYFIQNGWQIRPQEADHSLNINGNLFPIPETADPFAPPLGNFNVKIRLNTSSLTQAVSSGSGLSTEQDARLTKIEDILEADEEYTNTKAIKRHKDTKDVLVSKNVTGGADIDDIVISE